MAKGKFISIEGIEGAGKSTALTFIKHYLEKHNISVTWTREPGGTQLSEQIRKLLLHPLGDEQMDYKTELLMMFAARAQHLKNCILPALEAGDWVVSDRFIDASYAYQGGGRGIPDQQIKMLDDWIVNGHYPDLTILLDIEPNAGFARAEKRGNQKDRIEQEKMDFFARVRNKYLERAKAMPDRIKIIDASLALSQVEEEMGKYLKNLLSKNK